LRAAISKMLKRASFIRDFIKFRELSRTDRRQTPILWKDRYPCLNDNTGATGFDRHYIYHCAWAARVLADTRPAVHTDISSSLYFCTIASAFVPVRFYDYRPAALQLSNLSSGTSDLRALPFATETIESLSCMHVIEHVGLGRYGDSLDPGGDLKAMAELKRVLAPGGSLLFVAPLGRPRIMFNAHRIYSYGQIMEYFGEMEVKQFALIPDDPQEGGLVLDASEALADQQTYGCGCFWLKKKTA
jgi:SAM-dependent methyltransferase